MRDWTGQQLGDYLLIRLLGKGSSADVYLGEHQRRKTQAAIKVLKVHLTNEAFHRVISEMRTIRLKHPNIVSVLDFGVKDTTPFIVMDYAPHGSLRDRHPHGTQVAFATVVSYVRQIVAALHYLHTGYEEPLIHRDVKPENILVGQGSEILLSDFGIAVIPQSTSTLVPSEHEAEDGKVSGTALYMAPEQFRGKPRRASDQYALGAVIYEWLSGMPPFHGTFYQLAEQHMRVAPPPLHKKLPTIPLEVERVVMRALAKDPESRFPSVLALATALEQAYKKALIADAETITVEEMIKQGDTYYKAKRYEDAIAVYSSVLELDATSALLYARRGDAHRHLEKYQEAIADYTRALELDPTSVAARNNRGVTYHHLQEYWKAIADYNQALDLNSHYKPAQDNRNLAYEELKKRD